MTVLRRLIEGFVDFRGGYWRENRPLFEKLAREGQQPKVLIVACVDSRVDPGILTSTQPGDIFTIRNVGAIVPPYGPDGRYHGTSAALEFGVRALGVEHIVVLGHALCGGMRALLAEDDALLAQFEFLKPWTDIMRRAADAVRLGVPELDGVSTQKAVEQAAVVVSMGNVLTFPWVREKVEAGAIGIHGWYFDLRNGELSAFDPDEARFAPVAAASDPERAITAANAGQLDNDRLLARLIDSFHAGRPGLTTASGTL
ncbi:MAG: carbonic anhydrase [Alphaproteobacteria bacterium]|nr:carbonic anhydrase [Alphaproteobacteria bacterium]MCW5739794.1 carbonic anhydrase [Alphaproteobacteria bacterium]